METIEYIVKINDITKSCEIPNNYDKIRYIKLELLDSYLNSNDIMTLNMMIDNNVTFFKEYTKMQLCQINPFIHLDFSIKEAKNNNTILLIPFCTNLNEPNCGYLSKTAEKIKFNFWSIINDDGDRTYKMDIKGDIKITVNFEK